MRYFLLLGVLALSVSGVIAQDDPVETENPLLDLLAYVPATSDVLDSFIYYADYPAGEQARPGVPPVENINGLEALDSVGLLMPWLFALPDTTPPQIANIAFRLDEIYEVTGLDFFAVSQSMYFGNPPAVSLIMLGDFDTQDIIDAHLARDFIIQEGALSDDVTLLCGDETCDGAVIDLANSEPTNIFGGDLGRRQPLALADGLLLNAIQVPLIDAMLAARSGDAPSLAEAPAFAALANILNQQPLLYSVVFVNPVFISDLDPSTVVIEGVDPETYFVPFQESGLIPPYEYVALAGSADADAGDDFAHIALVYDSADDAQIAADVVATRITDERVLSLVTTTSFADVFAERGMTWQEPQIIEDEATGKVVALLTWRTDLIAAVQEDEETGRLLRSHVGLRTLQQMLFQRDVPWLSASIPAPGQ